MRDHAWIRPRAGRELISPHSIQGLGQGWLEQAEQYWLTTVRIDGRPHVTPLIGVAEDAAMHFCTELREQKARNLEHNSQVALTTGTNTWARGLDVVVEGAAVPVTDRDALQRLADGYEAKYGNRLALRGR